MQASPQAASYSPGARMKEKRERQGRKVKEQIGGKIYSTSQRKNLMREALFFKLDSNGQGLTSRTPSYGRVALSFGTHSDFIKSSKSVKLFVFANKILVIGNATRYSANMAKQGMKSMCGMYRGDVPQT